VRYTIAKAIPFVVHITQCLFGQPRENLLNEEPGGKGGLLTSKMTP